jgi:hypothetical protein
MRVIGPIERPEPLTIGDERTVLLSMLDYYRATLLKKCEGLERSQLELHAAEPSELTLLDLLRHLAGAERYWFQICFLGEQPPALYLTTPDDEIDPADPTTLRGMVDKFHHTCEQSRRAVAGHPSSAGAIVRNVTMTDSLTFMTETGTLLIDYAGH